MRRIRQYVKEHRFIQVLLFLMALVIAYSAGYATRRIVDHHRQQAAYDEMAQMMQEYRVLPPEETVETQEPVAGSDEAADPAEEALPEEVDLIDEFLKIEGNQEKYGEYLMNGIPDFNVLWAKNDEIVAYLCLPDSVINYPVLQNADNSYYLDHNIDGSTGYPGCLYIENMNRPDFNDPVTVIYGHHLYTGGMFSDLEDFLDREYFDEHQFYIVYLPGEIRIYEVVLAAKYNNEHLLVSCFTKVEDNLYQFHGFDGGEGKLIYDRIQELGLEGNYRSEHAPKEDDRMIYWSTCMPARNRRMIVGARLITVENIGELTD